MIFFALAVLGLLGYQLTDNLHIGRNLSKMESLSEPTLPPPQLSEEEKAVIFESIKKTTVNR